MENVNRGTLPGVDDLCWQIETLALLSPDPYPS
jgi:hypothetical protein